MFGKVIFSNSEHYWSWDQLTPEDKFSLILSPYVCNAVAILIGVPVPVGTPYLRGLRWEKHRLPRMPPATYCEQEDEEPSSRTGIDSHIKHEHTHDRIHNQITLKFRKCKQSHLIVFPVNRGNGLPQSVQEQGQGVRLLSQKYRVWEPRG